MAIKDDVVAILLIIGCMLIYLPNIFFLKSLGLTFLVGDCPYYAAITKSIIYDHDLKLENNIALNTDESMGRLWLLNGQLALGKQGDYVPKHPILLSLFAIPFYLIFKESGFLIVNMINIGLVIWLTYKLNRIWFDQICSGITTVLFGLGTIMFQYGYNFSPDVFALVFFLGGLLFLLKKRDFFGGIFFSLAIFAKLTNIIFLVPLIIWKVFQEKKLSKFGLGILIGVTPMLWVNHELFGSMLVNGYNRVAVAEFDSNGSYVLKISDVTDRFNRPWLMGILNVLFSGKYGMFPTNPVLVLSIMGIAVWMVKVKTFKVKRNYFLSLIMVMMVEMVVLLARYDEWNASIYGNRFLLPAIFLMSFFCSLLIEQVVIHEKNKH